MKISLIIPVYNSGQYLQKTLESVQAQTEQFFEVICVDNRSTDNSAAIIQAFIADGNGHVHYVYEEIAGPSAARNRGIAEATGDYVCFLDADDQLYPHMLTNLQHAIHKNPTSEIIAFNFMHEFQNGVCKLNPYIVSAGNYPSKVYLQQNLQQFTYESKHMVWSHCFQRSILTEQNIFNQEIAMFEDIIFLHKILAGDYQVTVTDFIGVIYHFIATSSTNQKDKSTTISALKYLKGATQENDKVAHIYIEQLAAKVLAAEEFQELYKGANTKSYRMHQVMMFKQKVQTKLMENRKEVQRRKR